MFKQKANQTRETKYILRNTSRDCVSNFNATTNTTDYHSSE